MGMRHLFLNKVPGTCFGDAIGMEIENETL